MMNATKAIFHAKSGNKIIVKGQPCTFLDGGIGTRYSVKVETPDLRVYPFSAIFHDLESTSENVSELLND
jgi:hypothetical protein